MVRKIIRNWKDGDSGTFHDGTTFRLSNVSAPEKRAPGYSQARARSRRMVSERDVVDVEVVGMDSFGRDLVKIKKRGRDVNKILEMKNRLLGIKPKKSKKSKKRK